MTSRSLALSFFGLAAFFTGGCASIGIRPEIQDVRARVTSLDVQGVDVAVDVDVKNPYPVALKTPSFKYGVDIDETPLFDSATETSVDLPASKVGTATLPLHIRYADLWKLAASLREAKEVGYRLRGAFVVNALGQSHELPLSHEGTFPVLRLPTFSVKSAGVDDLSLSSARLTVDAELKNPNVFDIDARGIGYTLRIGDVEVGRVTASTIGAIPSGASGRVRLAVEVTARSVLVQLAKGVSVGDVSVTSTGSFGTPYGTVRLPSQP
jgi:LEA14-like dessication related protein